MEILHNPGDIRHSELATLVQILSVRWGWYFLLLLCSLALVDFLLLGLQIFELVAQTTLEVVSAHQSPIFEQHELLLIRHIPVGFPKLVVHDRVVGAGDLKP